MCRIIIWTQQQNVIKVDNVEGKKHVTDRLNCNPTLTTESTSSINTDIVLLFLFSIKNGLSFSTILQLDTLSP